jgi:hypothetical protein
VALESSKRSVIEKLAGAKVRFDHIDREIDLVNQKGNYAVAIVTSNYLQDSIYPYH